MENGKSDTLIAGFVGLSVGFINFLNMYLLADSYIISVLKAGFAAAVCGFGGVAGKYLFDWMKKKYFNKIKKSDATDNI
jgi:hypothetical protein